MSRPDRDRPITGLCVVSSPRSCPAGYEVLYTTHDTHDVCNLWPESFFGTRPDRYICFARNPIHEYLSAADQILVDMILVHEKDAPPTGYTMILRTRDNGEKATKKKMICIKTKPRNSVRNGICEVVVVTDKRNIPQNFTAVGPGELNGMTICMRKNTILPSSLPLQRLPSPLPAVQQLSLQSGQHSKSQYYDSHRNHTPNVQSTSSGTALYSSATMSPSAGNNTSFSPYGVTTAYSPAVQRQQTFSKDNPLRDVPFVLDRHLGELDKARKIKVDAVSYRSSVDLDNEYSYTFSQEEDAIKRKLPDLYS